METGLKSRRDRRHESREDRSVEGFPVVKSSCVGRIRGTVKKSLLIAGGLKVEGCFLLPLVIHEGIFEKMILLRHVVLGAKGLQGDDAVQLSQAGSSAAGGSPEGELGPGAAGG